jgi:hypothetical protein
VSIILLSLVVVVVVQDTLEAVVLADTEQGRHFQ